MVQIPRLREWREARALTQVELAERAGISSRSVAGYEAGTGARLSTVRNLAAALGVEPTDLYRELDSPLAQAPPELEAEQRREPEVHTSGANLKGTGTVHVGEGFLLIGREGLARLLGRVERRELSANEAMDKVLEKAEIR
jgi:transcriptional regulator with XRE-family HTH domain